MGFRDHFSRHAAEYAAARPVYPPALFEHLAGLARSHELAWDCATGNGQAAFGLAPWFRRVVGSDASETQIAECVPHEQIDFRVEPAGRTSLAAESVDLVTVAQALHWFDLDEFYGEVRRVTRRGAVLAAWCYDLMRVTPTVDAAVDRLYRDIVWDHWQPERAIVEAGYRTLEFPFDELEDPGFEMVHAWDLGRLRRYLETWSSVQRYRAARGSDPLAEIGDELASAWGDPARQREVRWPVFLRAGRV